MSAPGSAERQGAAAACRNNQHELYEMAERLSRLRNELPDMNDRWTVLEAERWIKHAASICRIAADGLYKKEEQK